MESYAKTYNFATKSHRMYETTSELKTRMRKDLFIAYRDVTSKPCPSQAVAWRRTVKHPAPRYYVTPKGALNVVGPMARGDFSKLERVPKHRRKLYLCLFEEMKILAQKRAFQGKSLTCLITAAVQRPAPEFFITAETFRKIFHNAKRYGVDFGWNHAYDLNRQYTNGKDGKSKDAVFKGKLKPIIIR